MVSHTQCNARTIEEIFHDYKGRRAGLIKALTTDVEKFCIQFDHDKDCLWLYGYPTEEWDVSLPAGDMPPVLPEPVPGLNFARHGMQENVWLSLVAGHCDAWLVRVAFFMGSKYGLNKSDRDQLFKMINELPTLFEVVTGAAKKQLHMQAPKPQVKQTKASEPKYEVEELEEDDDDEHILCGACGVHYGLDNFWICCDICDKWFHGKCVMITPAMAKDIKQYKCPSCTNNKSALP